MSPTTEDLRAALRRATAPVTAAPDLATRVRAAADRRRRRRARSTMVLAPVAVVSVLAAAVLLVPRPGDGGPTSLPAGDQALLDTPTGGDRAGDAAFTARAVAVFLAGVRPSSDGPGQLPTAVPGSGPDGDPAVLWAGTTPAGPAAVVAQAERTPRGPVLAVGYLAPGPVLVAVSRANGQDDLAGAFLGPRTVAVVDRGAPLTWSYTHRYRAGGGVQLSDRPVAFRGAVAVLTVPPEVDPGQVEVTRPGPAAPDRVLSLGNRPGGGSVPEDRLPWSDKQDAAEGLFPVAGADRWPDPAADGAEDRYFQLLRTMRKAVETRPTDRPLYGSAGDDLWYAYGGTPDGRRLVATDMAADGDPTRAYVALIDAGGRSEVVDGGPVDRADRVPVRVRLPAGQGLLLAAKGRTFTWTADGQAASSPDAVLVPFGATDVRADGVPVDLP